MRSLIVAAFCLGLAACSSQQPKAETKQEEVKKYAIHGEIVGLEGKDKLATIKHSEIKGWMGAMTMTFPVKESKDFDALHVGEKIDGTVYVQGLNYWVGDVEPQKPGQ